jgi:hypothetical protein
MHLLNDGVFYLLISSVDFIVSISTSNNSLMYISTQHVYILFAQGSIKVAKVNELTLILDRSTLTFAS